MAAQSTRRNEGFIQMAAAFGRARNACRRALLALGHERQAFVDKHGSRASTDALAAVVPGLQDRAASLCEMKVNAAAVARAYRLTTDIRQSVLDRPVAEDMASEAEDDCASAEEAGKVVSALRDLAQANDAMLSACEALGDEFDDYEGEDKMAKTATSKAPATRPSGSFSTSGYAASPTKPYTVSRQLVQSLDRLGLPHSGGSLHSDDDDGGQITEQLIRALDGRYETYDTETGTRVRARRMPIGGYRSGSTELSGQLAVDKRAIDAACANLLDTLLNVENQLRFVEKPGFTAVAPRALRAVRRRIEKIEALAASPQGIPALQAKITAVSLAREVMAYLTAIGVEINIDDAVYDDWPDELFDEEAVTIPKTAIRSEELTGEVVEIGGILCCIRSRLLRASCRRSDAEVGYRLELALERAMYSARSTLDQLGSVEMADTFNLWRSIDIPIDDSCGSRESLGNGLNDALHWLIDTSVPFVEGDREIDQLGSVTLRGLAVELSNIADILEACSDTLSGYELEDVAASIAAQTSGLGTITRKCAEFAHQLNC